MQAKELLKDSNIKMNDIALRLAIEMVITLQDIQKKQAIVLQNIEEVL